MSFFVDNDAICITKGDDAVMEVSEILTGSGEEYVLQENDVLTLTVRKMPKADDPILLQIDSSPGQKRIVFRHEDTSELEVGRYSADIQLTSSDGKRYTIWPELTGSGRYTIKNLSNFVIMPEVTTK